MRDRPTSAHAIRVDLTLPSTKIGVGPLSYDPLKEMLGIDPRAALAPLLRAEPYIRTTGEVATEVFPLTIALGTGAAISLGAFGELALANDRGLLALTVPARATRWLRDHVGGLLVEGPTPIAEADDVQRVSMAWLRMRPGTRVRLPLGLLREHGLEAA